MPSLSIALTGATSASALWVAKALSEGDWNTLSLCSKNEESYTDLKKTRIQWLKEISEVSFGLKAENDQFVPWIRKHKPTLWIHHYHHMLNYRTSDYDLSQAHRIGIDPLDKIIGSLKETGCKGIIYSGSYFENSKEPSLYSLSKTQVGEELKKKANRAGILFSKIIVPDPTGPLENEDRFLPRAVQASRESKIFDLQLPNQVGDHLPMEKLGAVYLKAAQNLLAGTEDIFQPSGLVCTNNDWLCEIEENLIDKLGYKLKTSITLNKSHSRSEKQSADWVKFWENYLHFQKTGEPWRINK